MKWFLGPYTSRFNRKHKLLGHLFSGCYKSLVVDGSGTEKKIKMAERLRCETTMTLAWIAERPRMGTKTHLLYWKMRDKRK